MATAKQCDICGKYYKQGDYIPHLAPAKQEINAFVFGSKYYNYPMIFVEDTVMDICEDCKKAIEELIESRTNMNLGKGDKIYESN